MRQRPMVILFVLAIFAALLLVSGCGSNVGGVGTLDVNKVMTESPKIKQFQGQLDAKAKDLSDQLEKDKAAMSQEEFQKKQEAAYSDFLKMKQDFETQIDSTIKQSLEQVAKEKKLGIIIYKNGVALGGTDITDDVIKRMQ